MEHKELIQQNQLNKDNGELHSITQSHLLIRCWKNVLDIVLLTCYSREIILELSISMVSRKSTDTRKQCIVSVILSLAQQPLNKFSMIQVFYQIEYLKAYNIRTKMRKMKLKHRCWIKFSTKVEVKLSSFSSVSFGLFTRKIYLK